MRIICTQSGQWRKICNQSHVLWRAAKGWNKTISHQENVTNGFKTVADKSIEETEKDSNSEETEKDSASEEPEKNSEEPGKSMEETEKDSPSEEPGKNSEEVEKKEEPEEDSEEQKESSEESEKNSEETAKRGSTSLEEVLKLPAFTRNGCTTKCKTIPHCRILTSDEFMEEKRMKLQRQEEKWPEKQRKQQQEIPKGCRRLQKQP